MSRQEDICYMLESDRVWPPGVNTAERVRFQRSLVEVLKRLPDDAFDSVYGNIGFVIDDISALAMNVPPREGEQCGQIIIFRRAFQLSDKALVGLIAHEIAHSHVQGRDYEADEMAANTLAEKWGFAEELHQKDIEKLAWK